MFIEMTSEEMRELRGDRGAQEFGCHIADVMGKERAYTAQEVWNWENGTRPIPPRVATALLMYERRHWLIVPYGQEFLFRMVCPLCGARNPMMNETGRSVQIEFSCGAAERLVQGRQRKLLAVCKHHAETLGEG